MVARIQRRLVVAVLCAALPACGGSGPCGDTALTMGASINGLEVTPEEHPEGWGRADCLSCHAVAVLHKRACSVGVDYAELRELVAAEGTAVCQDCHGTNGVQP